MMREIPVGKKRLVPTVPRLSYLKTCNHGKAVLEKGVRDFHAIRVPNSIFTFVDFNNLRKEADFRQVCLLSCYTFMKFTVGTSLARRAISPFTALLFP